MKQKQMEAETTSCKYSICLVKQPFPSISYVKIWDRPIETTVCK